MILASLIGWGANTILKPRPSGAEVSAQAIHEWFRDNLNDADSIQLVSIYDAPASQQIPGAQALLVSYRAKNGFGAYRLVRDELMVIRNGHVVKTESPEERNRRVLGEQLDKVYDEMHGGSGQ